MSPAGFEALRLSIHGARRLFGSSPDYHVCVNSIPLEEAQRRTGPVPRNVIWHRIERDIPAVLRPFLEGGMSEGTAWKFIPLQLDKEVRELALDNDVILWGLPEGLRHWLEDESGYARLIAADVAPAHGQFAHLCGPEPRNSGIRGTPAGFAFEGAIAAILRAHAVTLLSELDEQGLQIAALSHEAEPLVVTTDEVPICSPFPPHLSGLGTCGAHFAGLNARSFPWDFCGRPAIDVRLEHWQCHRPELYARVGLEMDEAL